MWLYRIRRVFRHHLKVGRERTSIISLGWLFHRHGAIAGKTLLQQWSHKPGCWAQLKDQQVHLGRSGSEDNLVRTFRWVESPTLEPGLEADWLPVELSHWGYYLQSLKWSRAKFHLLLREPACPSYASPEALPPLHMYEVLWRPITANRWDIHISNK